MTIKIMLDPGHGGKDPGAVGNGLQEKVLALDIARRIRNILQNEYTGVEVRMTRENDTYLDLSTRALMANQWGADLFLSIHINAGGGTGWESFRYRSASSRTVAYQNVIHPEVIRATGVRDRGKKMANFAVLRETKMSAILTENLFIDNPNDAAKLKSEQFLQQIAYGHAQGISKAFGLKKKQKSQPKVQTQPQGNVMYRVVTGSFADRANAEKRVAELKKAGFDSFLDAYKHKGETFYRVVTGSFKNRSNAEKRQAELKRKGFDSFVDVYKK